HRAMELDTGLKYAYRLIPQRSDFRFQVWRQPLAARDDDSGRAAERVDHARMRYRLAVDLFERSADSLDEGRRESLVFHFVKPGNGTASRRRYFVDLLLGMAIAFQQQFRSAIYCLRRNEVCCLSIEAYLNPALRCRADESQRICNTACTQYCCCVHQLFINRYGDAKLIEQLCDISRLFLACSHRTNARNRFTDGDRCI